MLRGVNQQQIFEDREDCERFLQIVKDCKAISGYKLFAYCLMGNHIHLLIQENKELIDQIIKRIGSRFVYWYNIKYQRVGHLFQDRFKSEPVEDDAYFACVVRYIHQNPIKAGLCNGITNYEFSSFNAFFDSSDLIDKDYVFGIIPRELFEQFNNEASNEKCLEIESAPSTRVTDEQAQKIIAKISKCKNASKFQKLDVVLKEKYVRKIHRHGVSIRQISRLCGEKKGMVEKWTKQ